jgi:hypothetical protein
MTYKNLDNYYIYIYLDSRKLGRYCYENFSFLYKPFYVGKGKNGRYKETNSRSDDFIIIIKEIEKSGIEPIIIKLYENLSEEKSFELETKSIHEIGRIDLGTGFLINKTSGGQGTSGYKFLEETREIISKKRRKNFSNIKKEFEKRKYKLLTREDEYKNNETKLKYICPEGHESFIGWSHFQRREGCPICYNKLCSENNMGEKHPNHKLTEQKVIQIKILLLEGNLTQQEIADMFGVSQLTISDINTGKTWKHVK